MDVNSEQYLTEKICRAATRCLLNQINRHDTLHLKPMGISNQLTSPLSRLSPRAQEFVIDRAHGFFSFALDLKALEAVVEAAKADQAQYDLEHTFIRLRAPAKMMRVLFGFHSIEYSDWRKRLDLEGLENHCLRYCDEATEQKIWRLWEQYRHLPERECYLKIAEESSQYLNLIGKAIERYEKDGL